MGGGGEGDVAVPAVEGAAFEVVQAQGGFQLAVVVLDPPAQFRQPYQGRGRDIRGQVGPSDLRFATVWLKEALGTLDEETAAALPPAPEPVGPVSGTVIGQVCVVTENSKVSVPCPECQQSEGAQLVLDGDRVTCTCTMGHASTSRSLGTEHVRRAVDRAQAAGRVDGPLHVMHVDLPADDDLAKVCLWLRPV